MIAIVASRREELAGVLRPGVWYLAVDSADVQMYRRRRDGATAVLTGAGRERTEAGLRWFLDSESPEAVIGVGFAGGCSDGVDVGDLVLATRLHRLEGSPFDWDDESLDEGIPASVDFLERARGAVEIIGVDFVAGATATAPGLVRTPGLARWLGETYGVAAVDRESYWLAAATREAGLPFLSVRAVAYTAAETLPDAALDIPDAPSGGRTLPVLRYGARDPRGLWRRLRAIRRARTALATLMEALTGGSPEL